MPPPVATVVTPKVLQPKIGNIKRVKSVVEEDDWRDDLLVVEVELGVLVLLVGDHQDRRIRGAEVLLDQADASNRHRSDEGQRHECA